MIRKTIVNTLTCTGAALILLAFFTAVIGGRSITVRTFFEILGVNALINAGLLLTHKFESVYEVLEFLLDISYIIVILLIFGFIFGWFSSIPVWYLIAMAVLIYVFALITNIIRIHKDAKEINDLLKKRKEQKNHSVTEL